MNGRRALPALLLGGLTVAGLALVPHIATSQPRPSPLPAPPLPGSPVLRPAPGGLPSAKPRVPNGYVLTHEHPTNAMSFGGNYAFTGAPGNYHNGIMDRGYTAECGGCKMMSGCDHGEFKGAFTELGVGADIGDHKSHKGPVHDAFSHARYSTEWIKEAWKPSEPELRDARMRIFVAYAVENEAMCEQLYYANKGKGGTGGDGFPCAHGDSLDSLERQLTALKAWAAENKEWMEIAYNATDARRIAMADKLVVILGIEAEYSFGAENRTFDPVERLKRYYDDGVRTFYLAHKMNSRLAGADIYWPGFSKEGKVMRAVQAIAGCFFYDDAVGPFPLSNGLGQNFCDNNCGKGYLKGFKALGLADQCANKLSEISEFNLFDYVVLRGDGVFNGFKIYPVPPGFRGPGGTRMDDTYSPSVERNLLGLSNDGERVVRDAMLKGMMINIDHISSQARLDVQAVAKGDFGGYPLNAFHNNPNRMIVGNRGDLHTMFPHEYDFDDGELEIVRTTGGFFGVRVGPMDADDNLAPNSGVTVNCPKSATETAKVLAYLIDKDLDVGYGLDYATITEAVWSRTLAGCGRELGGGTDKFHKYGSEVSEGLSHVGMMKLFHQELATVGLRKEYLDKLKNDGAEAFIRMWERSEEKAKLGRQIPRQTTEAANGRNCAKDADCAAGEYCTAAIPVLNTRSCEARKGHGALCSDKRQCQSGRCSWGFCADADECQSHADCTGTQYCGDPIGSKRSCLALKGHGQGCTYKEQCQSGRCSWGFCADADECRSNSDCNASQYCAEPIGAKQSCKALHESGTACSKPEQCRSKQCSFFKCK